MGKEGEQQPKVVKHSRLLDGVERVGNKLPDPVYLNGCFSSSYFME